MKSTQIMTRIMLAAVFGAIMTGCAATHEMMGLRESFSALDVNEDDLISKREARELPAIYKSFNRFDTDGNNNISKAEFKAASSRLSPLNFKHLDFNNDGVLSEREASALRPTLKEIFDRVDSDGDDNVSISEYNAATVNLLQGVAFSKVDRDGDGVIDPDEAKVNPTLYYEFKSIDINEDDLISKTEFKWAQQL